MRYKNRSLLRCLLVFTLLAAILFPQSLWAAWEDDFWDNTREPLKITGIVIGAILGISLIIVLVAGAINEIKGDDVLMKHPLKSPDTSYAFFPLINNNPLLPPYYLDLTAAKDEASRQAVKTTDVPAKTGNRAREEIHELTGLFRSPSLFVPRLYKPLFSLPYPPNYGIEHGPLCGYDIERYNRPLLQGHIDMEIGKCKWDKVS